MRTARLVGPTADGTSVVLVTDDGEELSVVVDPQDPAVRAVWPAGAEAAELGAPAARTGVVRHPPRRRETSVETPLTPRDIQMRVRSGESPADLVESSGMDADRVERFAAPVLAEREHLALTALGSSVRRRGESSGHRPLRSVVAERLLGQGVDADDVSWDAWKRDDAHWQVSADYALEGAARHAEFRFDLQGRFSVADDDDARWLAGERPSPVAASVDRDDELALIRATREPSVDDEVLIETLEDLEAAAGDELAAVLQVVPPVELSAEELTELVTNDPESDEATGGGRAGDEAGEDDELTLVTPRDEAAEPTIAVVRHLTSITVEVDESAEVETDGPGGRSALDTLYDMLGGDGYAEDSPRVYAGLTDAAAVPEVDEHEFEPAAEVVVPVEPDAVDEPLPDEALLAEPLLDEAEPAIDETANADAKPAADEPEPLVPSPGASRKPGRRKRAAVPSWDEIMFGGPKPG